MTGICSSIAAAAPAILVQPPDTQQCPLPLEDLVSFFFFRGGGGGKGKGHGQLGLQGFVFWDLTRAPSSAPCFFQDFTGTV